MLLLDLAYLWRRNNKKKQFTGSLGESKGQVILAKTTKLAQAFICVFSAVGQRHPAQIPGKDPTTPLLQFSSKMNALR